LNVLTADAVRWAFTTGHAANWHPLTWLSLMLDCQLFGPGPGRIHLVNLLLHIVNTLLLFTVLKKMTGSLWPSAFVAAAFALHPMHVESVAWIAERKDVLSALFWMLTLLSYISYVKRPAALRYLVTITIFAIGLMTKPMLVTLPVIMLLLDYWPLGRISRFSRQIIYRLVLEKIPFFALTAISSVITFLVQRSGGAMVGINGLPLKDRTANAFLSYARYIGKMFWPQNLAVFYPFDVNSFAFRQVAICVLLLLVISIFVIRFGRNQKYLPLGWFWFVAALAPVIGFVQVGAQAYADRYTYIPYIGLFIMIAWGLQAFLSKLPQRKIILGVSMVLALTTLGICAHRQVSYWKNSITIFSHAIEITQNNYLAYNNRGLAYDDLGRGTEAMEDFSQAIRIKPDDAEAYTNLGAVYTRIGRCTEAIDVHKQAIKLNPDLAVAHYNLGNAYYALGRYLEAMEAFRQAIKIRPDDVKANYNLGNTYYALGRYPEAINVFEQAIKIKPDYVEAYYNLGVTYYALGRYTEAMEAYKQAIKIRPDLAMAYNNLGNTYYALGRYTEAIDAFKQSIKIKPDDAEAYNNLGVAYLAIGDKNSALAEYNILKSLNAEMANNLLNQINK
jgi:tetratricopeptide (TPR) repeat protein